MSAAGFSRTVRFVYFIVPLIAALTWGGSSVLSQASLDAPGEFVKQLGDRTIEVLSNESYSPEDRMKYYRDLLRDGFAVNTIARFALGRYWRGATPEVREEYLALFQEFVLDIYSKRLDGFSGETFTVIKSQTVTETDTMVFTEISGVNGPPIHVDYRVRSHEGVLQIVDVLVEGISLIVTQRSEFASVISRAGTSRTSSGRTTTYPSFTRALGAASSSSTWTRTVSRSSPTSAICPSISSAGPSRSGTRRRTSRTGCDVTGRWRKRPSWRPTTYRKGGRHQWGR